ncbi:DEAD/DEAH box helicase [Luteolibacter flavescens]|uniref:DEAD/DEAH box helicase n=1 Tax=Luteolibacter flavescens TaxID=1859460 RepID=A0ABT3FIP3_9BACT|nr:DEAD/DEAH box helicase [Luteolibacter flavescens]MCW1883443.1 DEAD/DEAH box helicase [Luteolibacter flavescens]
MEITEDWVRGLTGWKPFKEGKTMSDQNLVAGLKRSADGNLIQGTMREGKLSLRPIVKINGPSDVGVQCGCPEYRATGGVCAHAVAVLLSSIATKKASGPATTPAKPAAPITPVAWQIRLSPRLESEWLEGKLSVRLVPASGDIVTPSDIALTAWLADRGQSAEGGVLALRLAGDDAAALLDRIAGHPRIEIEGRPGPFRLDPDPGPPLRLGDSRLEGSQVFLSLDPSETRRKLVRWGASPAFVTRSAAVRLPAASGRSGWLERVGALAGQGKLRLLATEFLADLDAWLDLFEAPHLGWLGDLRFASAAPDFVLDLDGSLDSLDATLSVRYPGLSPRALPDPGDDLPGLPAIAPDGHLQTRQLDSEEAARHLLIVAGFDPGQRRARFQMRGRDAILAFVADDLPGLRQRWTVREGDRLAEVLKRVHVVRPEIEQKADFGSSLAFELSFQTTGGQKIPGPEMRRLLGSGKRRATLKSGAELVFSRDCEELVQPLVSELGIGRPDEEIRLSGAAGILFQNLREKLSKSRITSDQSSEIDQISNEGIRAELRPYQTLGSSWLADRLKRLGGALLADEMGLGKTLQTIASINHLKRLESPPKTPALVVAPTSLLGNWRAEFEKFAPGLKCLEFHGSGRDRLREQVPGADIVVTSYGTLVRDLAFHLQREYSVLVADEASLLRNPDAETSKALAKIQAGGRIALTGTPIENRVQDLWAIFRFIAPGYLGDRKDFKERYDDTSTDPKASAGLMERLRLRISPYVLRRTKEQVAKDLPDKIEIDEWLTLADDQAALYASLARSGLDELERIRDQQGEGAGRMHLLTLLLRLRQTCVDPGLLELPGRKESSAVKIDRLLELLGERSDNSGKTLVFSQFAKNLRRIEERLKSGYGKVLCLDGSTRNRQSLVDAFQSEAGPAVFLISLKAGGFGLNLTAADTVVHLDPWWNPAVEAQATDRAHRIGQTRPVTVYRLMTRDTVEERVRRMQDKKRALIDATTGDTEDNPPTNWTSGDLEGLLR